MEFDIKYLVGDVLNKYLIDSEKLEIKFSLKSKEFGEIPLDKNTIDVKSLGINGEKISLDLSSNPKLKESLENLNTYEDIGDKADSWFSGGQTGEEIYLEYQVDMHTKPISKFKYNRTIIPKTEIKLLLVPKYN